MRWMRFTLWVAGVLSLVCTAGVWAVGARPETPVPYLYYYSAERGAFIVERADGSDSQNLIAYTCDDCAIYGPGWSPSGRWLAWSDGIAQEGSLVPGYYDVWLAGRDGSEPQRLLNAGPIIRLAWSPTDDLLLINWQNLGQAPQYMIYDAGAQAVIFEASVTDLGVENIVANGPDIVYEEWTPDGQYVAVYYPGSESAMMKLISREGEIVAERQLYGQSFYCSTPRRWSSDGKVVYMSSDGARLIIEDFSDGSVIALETPEGVVNPNVYWSPDGSHALLLDSPIYSDVLTCEANRVWVLSLAEQTIEPISQTARTQYIGWQPIAPISQTTRPRSDWSPMGNSVYMVDYSWEINVLTVSHPEQPEMRVSRVQGLFCNPCNAVMQWYSGGERLMYLWDSSFSDDGIYSYDVVSGENAAVIPDRSTIYFFTLSADERYLMYSDGSEGGYVRDIRFGVEAHMPWEDKSGDGFLYPVQVRWHPTEPWLFVMGYAVNFLKYDLSVTDVSTTRYRDLETACLVYEPSSCFGWLPEVSE